MKTYRLSIHPSAALGKPRLVQARIAVKREIPNAMSVQKSQYQADGAWWEVVEIFTGKTLEEATTRATEYVAKQKQREQEQEDKARIEQEAYDRGYVL